jgi:hypothetical protein
MSSIREDTPREYGWFHIPAGDVACRNTDADYTHHTTTDLKGVPQGQAYVSTSLQSITEQRIAFSGIESSAKEIVRLNIQGWQGSPEQNLVLRPKHHPFSDGNQFLT